MLLLFACIFSIIVDLLRERRFRANTFYPMLTIIAGVVMGQKFVIRITGDLTFGFISQLIGRELKTDVLFFSILISVYLFFFVLISLSNFMTDQNSQVHSFLLGIVFFSFLGTLFLSHPGSSQIYFWQSAIPVVVLSLAVFVKHLHTIRNSRYFVIVAIGSILFRAAIPPSRITNRYWIILLIVVPITAGYWLIDRRRKPISAIDLFKSHAIASLAIIVLTSTSYSISGSNLAGGWTQESDFFFAINHSQIDAFRFLKANSNRNEIIASNSHCSYNDISMQICKPLGLYIAAISERRILAGADYFGGEDSTRFRITSNLIDKFLFEPTKVNRDLLAPFQISYILIDKLNVNFAHIDLEGIVRFGHMIYSNDSVDIIRIIDVGS